ncbi:endogenous retrovirus group K member 113 Env polyprotein-like [Chlorocebus sabaeus]|uniref:endogenous retrovirus group K member 113 Env polyprotein-like n=1 Tax=Chlorocebus sabaeus TaxID=60711 RepID=UPI003BF99519
MNPSEMQRKVPPRRQKHRNRAPLTRMMNQEVISEEPMKSPCTKKEELPTWAQLQKLTPLAGKSLASTNVTQTPEKMLLTALMIVSTVVSLPMPAGAAAANYTYWAYVPFPPLIRAVTWMDNPIEVYVNNSVWVPGPTDDRCPAKPEEEGMMINISIGYRYPPICLGRAPGCLMSAIQNWLVEVPTVSPTSRFTYHMVSGMSLKPQVNYLQDFSITATAAVAGVALHSSVQTVSFVDNWQKNSTRLWNSQSGINQKLANQINDLRQTVIWMGDRLMSLEHCFQLQCDWNTSDFCITPQVYNESKHHWDMVRRHLQGREDNLTLDISKLKEQIFEASQSHLNIVPGAEALDQVAKNLYGLNPTTWIKSIGNSTAVNFGIMCLCLIGLFLVCRTSRRILRQNRENEQALMTMAVLLKRKGGNVGKRKRSTCYCVYIERNQSFGNLSDSISVTGLSMSGLSSLFKLQTSELVRGAFTKPMPPPPRRISLSGKRFVAKSLEEGGKRKF